MMKKTKSTTNINCPETEELSDFFDNQHALSADRAEHIKTCPACQRIMTDFRLLELALKRHSTANIPENLVANITSGVRHKLQQPQKQHYISARIFLKVAAVLVFLAFAVIHSLNFFRSPASPNPVTKRYGSTPVKPAIQDRSRFNPYYDNGRNGIMPGVINENSIPLDNIIGANYGGNREPVFQVNNLSNDKHNPVIIPSSVHQVWVTEKPEKGVRVLNHALERLKVSPLGTTLIEDNGNFSGSVKLTKMQLVKLVRMCKNAGLDLLSPHAPQPEDNKFRGKPNTRINYNFDIVSPN